MVAGVYVHGHDDVVALMISMPFKLLLFVLVDGWELVAGSSRHVPDLGAAMDTSLVMDIVDSLKVTILVAAPILAAALISGLLVGILQAATSIQEMTLSFVTSWRLWCCRWWFW